MSQTQASPAPAFILDQNPTVRWPVTVRIPADGGQLATYRFEARIRVYSEDDYERLLPKQALTEDGKPAQRSTKEVLAENAATLPSFIADWSGVLDAERRPLPIEALREQLLHGPYGMTLSQGLWRAVHEVRYGLEPAQGGATLGNSAPSRDAGPDSPTPTATS